MRERPHPEYDPLNIRTGGFIIAPVVSAGAGYDSNVFGQTRGAKSDIYGSLDPSVAASSDWARNAVQVRAGATIRRYASATERNESGLNLSGLGRLDLGDAKLFALGSLVRGYEAQTSGATPLNARDSIRYLVKSGTLRGVYESGRFRLTASGDVNRITLGDTRAFDGTVLDQSFRNRTVLRGAGRIEYARTADSAAFVQLTYTASNYPLSPALGWIDRDSRETRVLGGVTLDVTHLIRATLGAGYVDRRYMSPAFSNIAGIAVDMRFEYFVTQLTTVTLQLQRQIEDSGSFASGGYFTTSANVRIDHELLRNLLLNTNMAYERQTFSDIPGRGAVYRLGGGGDYKLNRNLGFGLGAVYLKRTTSGQSQGKQFDEFRTTLTMLYRL